MSIEVDMEVRESICLPPNIREIMEERGFYEIDASDEGRENAVLYFFPSPLMLKVKEAFKLDVEPHFAIIQGGKIRESEEEILPQSGKKLKIALYTLEKATDGKWFFKTVENSASKIAEGFQKHVAGIISKKDKFFIPEEFPPREILKRRGNHIIYKGMKFVYRGKNS